MKGLLEILSLLYIIHVEKWIFDGLSGTFRLSSRMFLVCFSFKLGCNFVPDRVGARIFLVQRFSGLEILPQSIQIYANEEQGRKRESDKVMK